MINFPPHLITAQLCSLAKFYFQTFSLVEEEQEGQVVVKVVELVVEVVVEDRNKIFSCVEAAIHRQVISCLSFLLKFKASLRSVFSGQSVSQ